MSRRRRGNRREREKREKALSPRWLPFLSSFFSCSSPMPRIALVKSSCITNECCHF